jgi:predicted PurR-regulated permease PerM
MQTSYGDIFKRALIVVAVAAVPILIWYLSGVLLMTFGAIVLALLLRLGAEPFMRWLSLPQGLALLLSALVVLGAVAGAGFLFGTRIANELQDVIQRANSATAAIQNDLQGSDFGRLVLSHMSGVSFSITDVLSNVVKISATVLEGLVIMLISGIYLSAQPNLYRKGLISLFPQRAHRRAAKILDEIAASLRL